MRPGLDTGYRDSDVEDEERRRSIAWWMMARSWALSTGFGT
jgi:hypothetical protein